MVTTQEKLKSDVTKNLNLNPFFYYLLIKIYRNIFRWGDKLTWIQPKYLNFIRRLNQSEQRGAPIRESPTQH